MNRRTTQSDSVAIERTGDVLDIVLNRPDQRNVLRAAVPDKDLPVEEVD
jgi:enoyl-CoA hydratase/carnithine racemase